MKTANLPKALFFILLVLVMSCDNQNEEIKRTNDVTQQSQARISKVTFNGSEGDPLDLSLAKKWTANYRATLKSNNDVQAHFFGAEIIQQILQQPGSVGMRIYYALDDKGAKQLLLVGVDAQGNNILSNNTFNTLESGGDGLVADFSFPCPSTCPENGL
jgi:hypothetical protein